MPPRKNFRDGRVIYNIKEFCARHTGQNSFF